MCKTEEDGNEDPECLELVAMLRSLAAEPGVSDFATDQLGAAADFLASPDFDGDVRFEANRRRLETTNWMGGQNDNQGRGGWITVNTAVGNRVDMALSGWHEVQHHTLVGDRSHSDIYNDQARILGDLPSVLQGLAYWTQRLLTEMGL